MSGDVGCGMGIREDYGKRYGVLMVVNDVTNDHVLPNICLMGHSHRVLASSLTKDPLPTRPCWIVH